MSNIKYTQYPQCFMVGRGKELILVEHRKMKNENVHVHMLGIKCNTKPTSVSAFGLREGNR